jgi:HSP20 family protein
LNIEIGVISESTAKTDRQESVMSALTRYDPFDQFFPEMFRRFGRPFRFGDEGPAEIKIDVSETDKAYQVRAEMPGVKKDDIRVSVDGNFVSISAEVKKEKEEKSGTRVLVKETYVGSVSRGFSLANEIESKNVVAKLEDGVLKLTLPKREGATSRAIAIE